jgi:hypothetical protein
VKLLLAIVYGIRNLVITTSVETILVKFIGCSIEAAVKWHVTREWMRFGCAIVLTVVDLTMIGSQIREWLLHHDLNTGLMMRVTLVGTQY